MKNDVLLLADIFEKFIDTCLKFYGLDASHYFSSPGWNWDAMLKMNEVKRNCRHWHVFIHWKRINRSNFLIAKRYKDSNNKCMKNYDPKIPSKSITYHDKNNLCGCAMNDYLLMVDLSG